MARYIDADAAKEVIYKYENRNIQKQMVYAIERIPDADVQEVVHGEWVESKGMLKNAQLLQCSKCGQHQYVEKVNFCPHCGADMRKD